MRLILYALAGPDIGYGHYMRTLELHQEAQRQGHHSLFVTNGGSHFKGVAITKKHLSLVEDLMSLAPDWLVMDLPGQLPRWATQFTDRLCVIDGVGHDLRQAKVAISQGLEGQNCAPEYLILRQRLLATLQRQTWGGKLGAFVFGGSYDPMGLLHLFDRAFPVQPANLYAADSNIGAELRYHSVYPLVQTIDYYERLVGASFAVVGMGMIAWELAAAAVPTYVFSRSERHLATALAMQERGWIKAWPEVGLPDQAAFKSFCSELFQPTGPAIDGQGAARILTLLEESL